MKKQGSHSLMLSWVLVGGMLLSVTVWGAGPDTTAPQKDPDPVPVTPEVIKKYRRSKLTHDGSEGVADRRLIHIAKGEDRTVDVEFEADPARGIQVGDTTVCEVSPVRTADGRKQLLIRPKNPGVTNVTLRDADGNIRTIFVIRIAKHNLLRIASELRDLLRDIEGLEIRIVGPRVVLDGELLVPSDYGRLMAVLLAKQPPDGNKEDYVSNVLNLVSISPLAMQVVAKRIQDEITSFAPNVSLRVVNGTLFVEGHIDSINNATKVLTIANYYLPDPRPLDILSRSDPEGAQRVQDNTKGGPKELIKNFMMIDPSPTKKLDKLIRVTVHLVELAKDINKVFAFKWQPGLQSTVQINFGTADATGTQQASGTSFAGTIFSLVPRLNSAQQAGYARILKTATMIGKDKVPMYVLEKTALLIPTTAANGAVGTDKAEVGFDATITPQIVGQSEDILMAIKINMDNFTTKPAGVTSNLTTNKHQISNTIYVKSNESAVVAAIDSSDVATNFNKDDPKQWTSDSQNTDPLFTLHRSKGYAKKKGQFVVFVTPQLVENPSDGMDEMKKNFRVKVK